MFTVEGKRQEGVLLTIPLSTQPPFPRTMGLKLGFRVRVSVRVDGSGTTEDAHPGFQRTFLIS